MGVEAGGMADGPPESGSEVIEIAFVLAGAVSAGAWIAGVMDYIIAAMDAFEAWRQDGTDPDRPKHRISLSVLAGTSGGGMSAGLVAAQLAGRTPQGWTSVLHHAWVESIGLEALLTLDDLDSMSGEKPRSLLNAKPLDRIRDEALTLAPRDEIPSYVANKLHLFVTFTNLRGVGYSVSFQGGAAHQMSVHADYAHFIMSRADETAATDGIWLNPLTLHPQQDPGWKFLGQTVLASGAFPVGLAPQDISRPIAHYQSREWQIPRERPGGSPPGCFEICSLDPLPPPEGGENYGFWTVDGGVMDNEPLDLARRQLARPGFRNERDPSKARKVLVLVDPFPDPVNLERRTPDILGAFGATFSALISQARFKPDELILAKDNSTGSRFAITPSRKIGEKDAKLPILSGIFGGFGGFLDQTIREHDYRLGRRNAEKFLKDWFRLAKDNPVFGGWNGLERHQPKDSLGADGSPIPSLPIIPSRNPQPGVEAEPVAPSIPHLLARLRAFEGPVNKRLRRVVKESFDLPGIVFTPLWAIFVKKRLKNGLFATIEKDILESNDPA